MDRGLYVAASGGLNQARWLDSHANNLANLSVPGFKKDFQVYQVHNSDTQATSTAPSSTLSTRVFAEPAMVFTDFSQGQIRSTSSKFDVAISGEGFFKIDTEEGVRYTRKGDFKVNLDNQLTTKDGNPVLGESGVIELTTRDFIIEKDGRITDGVNEIGRFDIVNFADPGMLRKVGSGLYMPDSENIEELEADGATLIQGSLELSNASAVEEMVSMITLLRSYETHMKLIKGFDEMSQKAISLNNG